MGKFYKQKETDKIWWTSPEKKAYDDTFLFSFDKKKVYNLFLDYPYHMTEGEIEIFDKENPFWAKFFAGRKEEMKNSKDYL